MGSGCAAQLLEGRELRLVHTLLRRLNAAPNPREQRANPVKTSGAASAGADSLNSPTVSTPRGSLHSTSSSLVSNGYNVGARDVLTPWELLSRAAETHAQWVRERKLRAQRGSSSGSSASASPSGSASRRADGEIATLLDRVDVTYDGSDGRGGLLSVRDIEGLETNEMERTASTVGLGAAGLFYYVAHVALVALSTPTTLGRARFGAEVARRRRARAVAQAIALAAARLETERLRSEQIAMELAVLADASFTPR